MTDLAAIVTEIERHHVEEGWDQPPRLYALVTTRTLLENEPQLAEMLAGSDPEGLTPVEQEPFEDDVAEVLARIEWPEAVTGCALVNEVFLLPDGAVAERPEGTDETAWAEAHPDRRDVRIAVAVVRGGERASVLRIRGRDGEEDEVVTAPDLVPNLSAALLDTFA
ncbi:MAG TPA: PPA1309 family protein [Frankiaceae bacterium]|jgi:hypothetical protein|nr:PPA1309 family protein [Frankiaceae bacterium]